MTETVRCPACRGAKKVAKLGGMIGECNTCSGKGSILAADKPKPHEVEINVVCAKDLINAVADSVPASTILNPSALNAIGEGLNQSVEHKFKAEVPKEPDVKIDGKKAIYKRKRA